MSFSSITDERKLKPRKRVDVPQSGDQQKARADEYALI